MSIEFTKDDITTLKYLVKTELDDTRLTIALPSSLGEDYKAVNRKYAEYLTDLFNKLDSAENSEVK